MKNIPAIEAKELLSQNLICKDFGTFSPVKKNAYMHDLECGLLNADDIYISLHLRITYFYHPITKASSYTFSVFKKQPFGLERVYQLEINKPHKRIKDKHKMSHQHYGDIRSEGNSSWNEWKFSIALQHFLEQTNITLIGKIESPEEYNLYARK